jgi:ubiquinone biosynthesis protein UbiJ
VIKHWLFARAEKLLGRQVAESTAATELLESLEGRSFAVHVEGLALGCVLRVARGRILVEERVGAGSADAEISGTPLDLIALLGPDMASRLPGSAARLTGVVHVAEKFADVLRLARPDFED